MNSFKWLSNSFRSLDMFGESVALYYRGKSQYQTKIGALWSIIIFVIVGTTCYKNAIKLINLDDPTIQQYNIKLPENEIWNIQQSFFDVKVQFLTLDPISGSPVYIDIPENFLDLQAQTLTIAEGKKGNMSNPKSARTCDLSDKMSEGQRSLIKRAKCFNLSTSEVQGFPAQGSGKGTIIQITLNCMVNKTCDKDPIYLDLKNKQTIVLVSTQEISLDFTEKKNPFLQSQSIVIQTLLTELVEKKQIGTPKARQLYLQANEANINDQIWRTPFNDITNQIQKTFLTSLDPLVIDFLPTIALNGSIFQVQLFLKDKKVMSLRTVYGYQEYLSDIGGLAGMYIPLVSQMLKLLQIPRLYIVSLMKHLTPVNRKKTKKRNIKRFQEKFKNSQDIKTLEDQDLIQIIQQMKSYVKFRTSIFTRLFASYLPQCLQSATTKQDVTLMNKFEERMKQRLDVRQIMRNDDDLRLLLKYLMTRQRYWLFCHQSSRVQSVEDDEPDERDDIVYQAKSLMMLRNFKVTSTLDRRLIRGMLK